MNFDEKHSENVLENQTSGAKNSNELCAPSHLVTVIRGNHYRKKIQNQHANNNSGFFSPVQYGVEFFELITNEFVCIKWHTVSVFFSIFKEELS